MRECSKRNELQRYDDNFIDAFLPFPSRSSFRKHTFYTYSYARLIRCFIRFQYVCEYIFVVRLSLYVSAFLCRALVRLLSFVLCLLGFYCNDFWHIYWLLHIQVDVYLSLSLCLYIFFGCRHQTIRIFRIRWFIGIEWELFTWCTHEFDGFYLIFWLNLFLIFHSRLFLHSCRKITLFYELFNCFLNAHPSFRLANKMKFGVEW